MFLILFIVIFIALVITYNIRVICETFKISSAIKAGRYYLVEENGKKDKSD